jgi:hypothetical protein
MLVDMELGKSGSKSTAPMSTSENELLSCSTSCVRTTATWDPTARVRFHIEGIFQASDEVKRQKPIVLITGTYCFPNPMLKDLR